MTLSHYYDGKIVIVTLRWRASAQDDRAALLALCDDRRLAGVPILIDARACGEEPHAEACCERIDQILAAPTATRYAVVGGQLLGKCAACQSFRHRVRAQGLDVRLFHDLGGALRWLWNLDDGAWGRVCALPDAA